MMVFDVKMSNMPRLSPRARATVGDIARLARVSTATVDRVLNRRATVRDSTVQQVLKAAAALDYLPEKNLRTALNPKPMRISFLLPKGTNSLIKVRKTTRLNSGHK